MRKNGPGQNGQQPRQKGGLVGFLKHSLINRYHDEGLEKARQFEFMRVN